MMLRLTLALTLWWPLLAVPQAEFGAEVCGACHEQADAFVNGPHGSAMARIDPDIVEGSCTGCHGDPVEHLGDPSSETIVARPDSGACDGCHGGSSGRQALHIPAHQKHGVQCLDCHDSGHGEVAWEALLMAEPIDVCGSCHGDQKSASHRPFAHRDGAQPFQCTECHAPHGDGTVGRLSLFAKDAVCTRCHTELAGPFVYPHAPLEVEGCGACHAPHGSTNPRSLVRRTTLTLCLECHAEVPSFHDVTDPRYRACVNCHSAIHGSNRSSSLFDR